MSFYDFIFGGLSGMIATSIIQPIDTIKVRIQLVSEAALVGVSKSPFKSAYTIFATDGVKGFYNGLDSALFRQATYTTTRLGLYKYLFSKRKKEKGEVLTREKILISLFSGFVGSMVGNPSDLVLVRFQSDSYLPAEQKRNYKNVFNAFARIVKEEGWMTLWRGSSPTVGRAMAMNMGMMTTYDEVKERINKYTQSRDLMSTQIISSLMAGFVCASLSLPFDNAKTKLQKMTRDKGGHLPYKGLADVFIKSVAREGVRGLWVGFLTYYFRVGNHAMIVLLTQDYLQSNFNPHNKK
jgi:solute carrier family 25 oxoglutarate transporter 11